LTIRHNDTVSFLKKSSSTPPFVVCDQFLAAIPTHREVIDLTTRIVGGVSGEPCFRTHPVSDLKGS
jgi:hypothetical protein